MHPAVAATCTQQGSSAYYSCPSCGKYFSDESCTQEIAKDSWVIVSSHKLTSYPAIAATCTQKGNIAYWYCSECKKYFSDES
jgi:NAD-dependent SIR2 family protein deacetylase